MKIIVLTLFPEIFQPVLSSSILGRAAQKKLVEYQLINIRDFGQGVHSQVDDRPYGGGVGMILKPDVLAKAWKSAARKLQDKSKLVKPYTILMSASGSLFNQNKAQTYSKLENLILVAGHYEGVDQRFIEHYVDEEISIGDYVLTGGEIPAMVVIDALTRLVPQVLLKSQATEEESFSNNLLEYPQYTRPLNFEGSKIPEILLSGNHAEIKKWRSEQSYLRTKQARPDLIDGKKLI